MCGIVYGMLIATHAADVLFIVASICIVLLTLMLLIVGFAIIRAVREAQRLMRRVEHEAMRALEWQDKVSRNARFAGKWLRIIAEHFINGRN